MKIRTQFDEARKKSKGTVFYLESKTLPDQTLSVRQLLINHTRGIPVPTNTGQFFDEEIPVIQDINDLQDFREKVKSKQLDLEDLISQVKAEKEKLEKAVTEFNKKSNNPQPKEGGV